MVMYVVLLHFACAALMPLALGSLLASIKAHCAGETPTSKGGSFQCYQSSYE